MLEEGALDGNLEEALEEGATETVLERGATEAPHPTVVEPDLFENVEPEVVEEIEAITNDDVTDDRVSEMPTPPEPPTHGYNLRNRED